MDLSLKNSATESSGDTVEVSDAVFGVPFNEDLVHQVVTAYLAAGRAGTKAQKTRSEVRGGGIKPWRQKGTGRARSGTSRSPIWRSGGVTFAAKPRNYEQKVNRKMYRAAMRSIVSELLRQDRLHVVSELDVAEPKTRLLAGKLKDFGVSGALLVSSDEDLNLSLASRNIPGVGSVTAQQINPVALISFENVMITVPALKQLEGALT